MSLHLSASRQKWLGDKNRPGLPCNFAITSHNVYYVKYKTANMLTDEQMDSVANSIESFLKERQPNPSKSLCLSPQTKKQMVESIRLRAQAHGLGCLITHALKNSDVPDPLLCLDDRVLFALDKTLERSIKSIEQGISPEEAGIIPLSVYLGLDLSDPYQKKIHSAIVGTDATRHVSIVQI